MIQNHLKQIQVNQSVGTVPAVLFSEPISDPMIQGAFLKKNAGPFDI